MNSILCSNGFRQFFNAISADAMSTEDMLALITNSIIYITEELKLGKLEINYDVPGATSDSAPVNKLAVLYEDEDGYELLAHSRLIKQKDKSVIGFAAFPMKGVSWTVEEKDAVDFLIKNIHVTLSRASINEQFNKKQLTDYLTALPNTSCFMMFANDLVNKGLITQYTVIFSNLKNFNYINQQLGSKVGDRVLKEYSKVLLNSYKKNELVARFGGDNFVAILKNDSVDNYLRLLKNVPVSIASGNMTQVLNIGARVGVYPILESTNINDAISRANACLFHAKNTGVDQVIFESGILDKITRERDISASFKSALAHKEFLVYYQPKVNIKTKRISGCEALVRWQSNGKILPPGVFIPVLEREGKICELDFYMLDRVCSDIREWLDAGITPARVSVNFSKLHLRNQTLAHDIMAIVDQYRIDPKYIEIELTETSSYEDFGALISFVNELRGYGIYTSLDDFGTGYSSLNLLTDLQVSVVKIDKSFIDKINVEGSQDKIILRAILAMVAELGMEAIAEGVETVEQALILKDMNCNMIQGYLFDKPLNHDEYTEKLSSMYEYPVAV